MVYCPFTENGSGKNGSGKNSSAKAILDEKMVQPDHSWLIKNGLAGPILVTKSGQPDQNWSSATNSALMSPRCVSFQVSCVYAPALAYIAIYTIAMYELPCVQRSS